jgi:tRNA modification GTPase
VPAIATNPKFRPLTPRGQGGINVVAVWGDGADAVLDRLFVSPQGRHIPQLAAGDLVYGTLIRDGDVLDEVIICKRRMDGAHYEINCHGGIIPLQRVMSALRDLGCVETCDWDALHISEGYRFGADGGLPDAVRWEATEALPGAKTHVAAKMLLDQAGGALSTRLGVVLQELTHAQTADARSTLAHILATANLGIRLCQPPRIVVAGRPNVGKSTLSNRLLAEERSLVHHLPGTTRDVIEEFVSMGGYPFRLADTAGIAREGGTLDELSAEKSREAISLADIVLVLFDGSTRLTAEDKDILHTVQRIRVIPVVGKTDLPAQVDIPELERLMARPMVRVSARTGEGISALEKEILDDAFPLRWQQGMPVVFTRRQRDLMAEALAMLDASVDALDPADCVQRAQGLLGQVLRGDASSAGEGESR